MKILVVNLMRLGDLIQIVPVLRALRAQYPLEQMDLLTFSDVGSMRPMVEGVENWWTLNRKDLQSGLGRADLPLLSSFSILKEKLDRIDGERYDCIVNLTHTQFSGWICGYLNSKNRLGLAFDRRGVAHFHSPWFSYLDEHAPLGVSDIFHYTDIFHYGCGLKGSERDWSLRETERGREEFRLLNLGEGPKVIVQLLTSDAKKNWSTSAWLDMLKQLRVLRPKHEFVVLGAPSEQMLIQKFVEAAKKVHISIAPAIVSMEGALSLLKAGDLLITGDTSIKHLANATSIRVLELSLGSSDHRRTGAYKADSLILQPRISCAPCPHSAPCHRETHACAQQLAPEIVSLGAHHLLDQNWTELRLAADEFSAEASFLRPRILKNGYWMAIDIENPAQAIKSALDRSAWKFTLNREDTLLLPEYGSEGVLIHHEFEKILAGMDWGQLGGELEMLEHTAIRVSESVVKLQADMRRLNPSDTVATQEKLARVGEFLRLHTPEASVLTEIERATPKFAQKISQTGVPAITGIRKIQAHMDQMNRQSQVKIKLIRSFKAQLGR